MFLLSFYHIDEIFGDVSGNLEQSGDDSNTISLKKGISSHHWNSAFGKMWINSMSKDIISWNIKFDKLGTKTSIGFGLISNKHNLYSLTYGDESQCM